VRTSFSQANWDLTKAAHLAAQTQVYPRLWPNATKLQFVDKTKSVMDLEYAIDCIAAVSVEGVWWRPDRNKWQAQVEHNGRVYTVGSYSSIEDAAAAVKAKRLELFTHNDADRLESA